MAEESSPSYDSPFPTKRLTHGMLDDNRIIRDIIHAYGFLKGPGRRVCPK